MQRKRAFLNVFWGLFNKILVLLLGLVVPKVILLYWGSNTNGIISTINQIYGCVTILEAGVGYATTQALYQPIFENNKGKINEILSATHVYYRRIGIVYLGIILLLTYFFPLIGKPGISAKVIREVVFLTGIAGVLTFFFQGKFLLLLEAEGKSYIAYNVNTISTIATQLLKIILIVNGLGIVYIQLIVAMVQISVMLYYLGLRNRKYFWVDFRRCPDFKAIEKKNSVFFHRVCFFVFSNTDIVLVSAFLSYDLASVYTIYSLMSSTVYSLAGQICTSTTFYWGQKYNSNRMVAEEHLLFQKVYYMVVFAANSILYIMAIPFVRLYTEGVTDIDYIDNKLLILFVIMYTLQGLRLPLIVLTELTGRFKETQKQAIIESIMNLTISLLMVNRIGIYGILLGTIIAIGVRNIVLIKYITKEILYQGQKEIYSCWAWNLLLAVIGIMIGTRIIPEIISWYQLIVSSIKIAFIIIIIFTIGNCRIIKKGFMTWRPI